MLAAGGNETGSGSLDGRVAGLNGLLRERKVGPDEDVNVSRIAGCGLPEAGSGHR